jgi:integrase
MKLSAKKCHKCGASLNGKRKTYKVVLRSLGHKITRTTTNLELAREIEGKLLVDIGRKENDLERRKPSPTLGTVWKKYETWAKENKKSWRTDKYHYHKHLEPSFGNKQLDQISPFDIEKLILQMKKGKSVRNRAYAPATIKHQIVLLSRLYSLAIQWGIYSGGNPCNKVRKPKLNNKVTEFLTDDEQDRLFEVLNKWDNKMSSSIIKFAIYTGFRRGEIFKLTWNDVDIERKTAILRDPKGKTDQTIPLSSKVLLVLKSLPRKYDTPWIFYGKNGKQRTDFKGLWQRIRKEAKLPDNFRFHGLRHHFASTLASNGVDLYTIQKLLTHKDASTTQRYAHLSDKTLRDAVDLSDKLIEPKAKAEIVSLGVLRNG